MLNLAQEAIKSALNCDWISAREINLQILANNPNDIDALNRLSKALYELGETKKAIEISNQVLLIDPLDKIANRAIEKYQKGKNKSSKTETILFIEEPGRTKIVNLINLDCEICPHLSSGEKILINHGNHKVSASREDGKYIGKFKDDISKKIINLINAGNRYDFYVHAASANKVTIFIKQTHQEIDVTL